MIVVPAVDLAQLVLLAHPEGPETREHRDRLDSPANRNLRLANKSPKYGKTGGWMVVKNPISSHHASLVPEANPASQDHPALRAKQVNQDNLEIPEDKLHLENLDLRIFSESIIDIFQPAASRKNIRLHLECPEKSIYFLSDRQLLTRMTENLLSNAIKYTEQGKNVWMSVSEEKDAISIKVRDEGVGIEKDELPHLFSKYSKVSSQPTNGEPSTGLGLSIVKRICEELHGKISCESRLGEGSIFTVVLKK